VGNFFTEEIVKDARFQSTERVSASALLEPITRAGVAKIVQQARALGIDVVAFETYRSLTRQAALFAQGTTQVKTGGVHHYGLACDIVKIVDGAPTWEGDYSFLGHLAHANGLIWGGDWGQPEVRHSFVDAVHVQRCIIARQEALFAGEWYPGPDYDPYEDVKANVMGAASILAAHRRTV